MFFFCFCMQQIYLIKQDYIFFASIEMHNYFTPSFIKTVIKFSVVVSMLRLIWSKYRYLHELWAMFWFLHTPSTLQVAMHIPRYNVWVRGNTSGKQFPQNHSIRPLQWWYVDRLNHTHTSRHINTNACGNISANASTQLLHVLKKKTTEFLPKHTL